MFFTFCFSEWLQTVGGRRRRSPNGEEENMRACWKLDILDDKATYECASGAVSLGACAFVRKCVHVCLPKGVHERVCGHEYLQRVSKCTRSFTCGCFSESIISSSGYRSPLDIALLCVFNLNSFQQQQLHIRREANYKRVCTVHIFHWCQHLDAESPYSESCYNEMLSLITTSVYAALPATDCALFLG